MLLIELNEQGKPIKFERFFHQNYACCLQNINESFFKVDDYFAIKTCGTGSGYCASYLYLFKDVIAQEQQNPIPLGYWSSFVGDGNSEHITSSLEFADEKLLVHYQVEQGQYLFKESKFMASNTHKFTAEFVYKNHQWLTTDSLKLATLDW